MQPAADRRPLSCSLSVVSLESKLEYETLSYVWGDPSLNSEIITTSGVLKITNNLHTALWYLRSPDVPRVIWTDAICINQFDLHERSSQVRVMDDIYRHGKGVQIWLGETKDMISNAEHPEELDYWIPEDRVKSFTRALQSEQLLSTLPTLVSPEHATVEPNIPGAIRILELLNTGHHFYQMPFFRVIGQEAIGPCPVWSASMRSLTAILSRPWWTRVWTMQEAMLSAQATVRIGEYQAPLSLFSSLFKSIRTHENGCCGPARDLWYGDRGTSKSLLRARSEIGAFLAFNKDGLNGGITILRAFWVSCRRKASDPRDHVYALHGILYSKDGLIEPSYELSTDKVFTNATRVLFQEGRSIDALMYAIGVEPNNAYELPSWVCDWTRQPGPIISRLLYKASNGERFMTEQTTDRILAVEACKVDLVSTIKNPTGLSFSQMGELKEDVSCLEKWWSLLDIKDSKTRCAFWTTVLLGMVVLEGEVRRIQPNHLITIEAWWELATSAVKQGKGYATFHNSPDRDLMWIGGRVGISVRAYKFWLTSQGFMGMGPQTLERGDEVFVAKGSRVPLIFRPIEDTLAQSFGVPADERGYLFVGQCYLHGFMDGEAVKPDTKWQTVHLC